MEMKMQKLNVIISHVHYKETVENSDFETGGQKEVHLEIFET